MIAMMWGRSFRRGGALVGAVIVAVLAGTDAAGAQPRRLRVAAAMQAAGQPPGAGTNENVDALAFRGAALDAQ